VAVSYRWSSGLAIAAYVVVGVSGRLFGGTRLPALSDGWWDPCAPMWEQMPVSVRFSVLYCFVAILTILIQGLRTAPYRYWSRSVGNP
jgi:hypothetical protein